MAGRLKLIVTVHNSALVEMTIEARPGRCLEPRHWDLLEEIEQEEYRALQAKVSAQSNRNRRNKSAETFNEILESVKAFVMKEDGREWKRALVTGLFWVTCFIVVNTKQLCILLQRSKSSINSSFQALGYSAPADGLDTTNLIINCFDCFKNDYNELRQWTLRAKVEAPKPFVIPRCIPSTKTTEVLSPPSGDEPAIIESSPEIMKQELALLDDPFAYTTWPSWENVQQPDYNSDFLTFF